MLKDKNLKVEFTFLGANKKEYSERMFSSMIKTICNSRMSFNFTKNQSFKRNDLSKEWQINFHNPYFYPKNKR